MISHKCKLSIGIKQALSLLFMIDNTRTFTHTVHLQAL